MSNAAAAASNSVLASIFVLSLLLLFLVPYTLYILFGSSGEHSAAAPAKRSDARPTGGPAKKLKPGASKRWLNGNTLLLLALWTVAGLLVAHVRFSAEEVRPFDPFEILGVTPGATEKDIKRAYRQLSLKFHPDKNPDPSAASYFAEFISPAYKALTDETARANLEKHGHPDGPQGMSVGVALPAFLFEKGAAAPFVLAAIVGVGIVMPLCCVLQYIRRQQQYSGTVLQQTVAMFGWMTESKNSLSATKVGDILVFAAEFTQIPARQSDEEPLAKLLAQLRQEVDTKNPMFVKMHPAFKKATVLLAAQMNRRSLTMPEALVPDMEQVQGMLPLLLEELLKLAMRPRPPHGYMWLRPALSVLEYTQNLTQALPISSRGTSSGTEGMQSLMQLPGVDQAMAKKLNNRKIRSLSDLLLLDDEQRVAAVASLGLPASQLAEVDDVLGSMPCVTLKASCSIEGEEQTDIHENDFATCTVTVHLERLHDTRPAGTPYMPAKSDEGWWLLLGDLASNTLFAVQKVPLRAGVGLKRFRAAAKQGASPAEADNDGAQEFKLRFRAPQAGLFGLHVMCLSDTWIGCDTRVPLKLKVNKAKRDKEPAVADARSSHTDDDESGDEVDDHSEVEAAQADEIDLTESGTSESDGDE